MNKTIIAPFSCECQINKRKFSIKNDDIFLDFYPLFFHSRTLYKLCLPFFLRKNSAGPPTHMLSVVPFAMPAPIHVIVSKRTRDCIELLYTRQACVWSRSKSSVLPVSCVNNAPVYASNVQGTFWKLRLFCFDVWVLNADTVGFFCIKKAVDIAHIDAPNNNAPVKKEAVLIFWYAP